MSTSSPTRSSEPSSILPSLQERSESKLSVTLSENALLAFALLRIFIGYLWFQELFWKLPPTFAGLRPFVVREVQGAFIPGYGAFVQYALLPNFGLVGTFTFIAEFLIGISLLFGIFSRAGALLATIMAVQLYIGLSTTEWYWTYGMLVLLALVLLPFPTGRRLGIDQWLAGRLQKTVRQNRIVRMLSWFV